MAPVTSSRPEDWTWITARWITRWKPAVGLESCAAVGDEVRELGVDIVDEVAAQDVEVDVAGAHDGGRVLIVDQGEEEMLERGVFVPPLAGEGESSVEGLFEAARKARQGLVSYGGECGRYFFSMTHWSGCWCLRAKSITCVTLVSATS